MGRLEEQMVTARESRANSKSETAASHNTLLVVLTTSSFFSSYSKNEKFNSYTPSRKESITLCCKNAVCKELGLSDWLGSTCALPVHCSLVSWKREVRS